MKILILSLPLVFRFDEFTKDGNNPTERHFSYLHFLKKQKKLKVLHFQDLLAVTSGNFV